ncbi:MAG: hypothetical protein ACP5OP_07620 [Leptospirillia bacterium]
MAAGAILSIFAMVDLLKGESSEREILLLDVFGALAWLPGVALLPPFLRLPYALVPFVLPLAGPPLVLIAVFFFVLSRRSDYLADDPMLQMIFHPPAVPVKRNRYTLEDILSHDRMIVSAGDILRWGDVSLKQALIDRLASRNVTPRAIRILREARGDPDDEVRLFATTILTRIEKTFQERTTSLRENPDPVAPHATLGKAYLEYAESGLLGDRLARGLYQSALAAFEKALEAEEPLSREELSHLANVAATQRNPAVFFLVRQRLAHDCNPLDLQRLEWVELYESGQWQELKEKIRASAPLWEGKDPPSFLSVWMGSSREVS